MRVGDWDMGRQPILLGADWNPPILDDVVTHMKTTIEISDDVLLRARQLAQREGTTIRALAEEGLRLVLERREASPPSNFEPVVYGTTPLESLADLHQLILDSYGERTVDRFRRLKSA